MAYSYWQVIRQNEHYNLLYKVYLDRIDTLREQVLAEDWDGSFTHRSKQANSDIFCACLPLRAPSLLTCRPKSVKCASLCAMGD